MTDKSRTHASPTCGSLLRKKPYSQPALRVYGTVRTLTKGNKTSGTDANGTKNVKN